VQGKREGCGDFGENVSEGARESLAAQDRSEGQRGRPRRLAASAARPKEIELPQQRRYRKFTPQQKLEIVLAGLRGDRSVRDVCREHDIAETLYYDWRDKLIEAGKEVLAGKEERHSERELRRKVAQLERALGRKTYELEGGEGPEGLGGCRLD